MAGWLFERKIQVIDLAAGAGREGTGQVEPHRDGGGLRYLTIAPLRRLLEGSQVQKRSPSIQSIWRVGQGGVTRMRGLSYSLLLP